MWTRRALNRSLLARQGLLEPLADPLPRVFATKIPQSVNTFLVDGEVAGRWRWADDHVAIEPFAPVPAATLRAVEEAAAPLAQLYA